MNRLAAELSPYLKQHAHNPVDWFPWGPEAFEKARAELRPILLSIGYSACHWCHVMERESFESEAIAKVMNERFVSVKVDREERPDVDHVYQLVVQMMGRSGGWPLTVFLTPTLEPFFGGTYFPNVEKYGMPSFTAVLDAVHDSWTSRRGEIESSAKEITAEIQRVSSPSTKPGQIPRDVARGSAMLLSRRYDDAHGGFGTRPKFPNTMALELLIRAAHDGDQGGALARADKALVAMRTGGIWDQLGGGYHRYSTDEHWLVPHFEKMLYDNALLLRAHAEAFRAGCGPLHEETVRGIVRYLETQMRSPEGLFYATEDADSEGEEGRFFVWTREQLDEVLGEPLAKIAALRWGVEALGNFEHSAASVLSIVRSVDEIARELGLGGPEVLARLEEARTKLHAARAKRARPFRDEKIIASWNGLAIGALAVAGGALGEPKLIALAKATLTAIEKRLFKGGVLHRIRKDGHTKTPGFLEDYADVASAAIDVYEASDDAAALAFGRRLFELAKEAFWEESKSTFYFARRDASDLIARTSDAYDHAVPSAVATMAHVALRLSVHLSDPALEALAKRVLDGTVGPALASPLGLSHALAAMDRLMRGPTEIYVVGAAGDAAAEALLTVARASWQPNAVIARLDPGASDPRSEGKTQIDGRATAYVCRERTCGLPITEPEELRKALRP
jgi:uncharacterized protein YyaL (SSP411 family)